ncbi:MAG: DUF1800 family protein [Pseudomonadota bacterium]|nr:DUF1800 family protein [Pseudomonadota bacterium]
MTKAPADLAPARSAAPTHPTDTTVTENASPSFTSTAAPAPGASAAQAKGPAATSAAARVSQVAGLSALMSAVLAACGGGDDAGPVSGSPVAPSPAGAASPAPVTPLTPPGGTTGPVPAPAPTPAAPAPASPASPPAPAEPTNITAAEAARFLQQAQFSASDAEISAVQQKGYGAWLDEQMRAPISQTGWDWLQQRRRANGNRNVDHMIWKQLIDGRDAVRKRVALAWSEIFVVSVEGVDTIWNEFAMAAYWDLLNTHAFGNYRQFLEALSLNPAMGFYLNTRGNRKADARTGREPDENYAREVMQLFSVGLYQLNTDGSPRAGGAETYNNEDVSNLARVFTGYRLSKNYSEYRDDPATFREPMVLNAADHASESVRFLGKDLPATDGTARLKAAMDVLASHDNVGPFMGRQLIQRLVTSNPSRAYVGRVAAAFNNNGAGVRGDLRAVTRAVLLDPEARQDPSLKPPTWGKLREPMIRFVQWARTFSATSSDSRWVVRNLSSASDALGQSPLRSPSVFNFFRPGYVAPGIQSVARGLTTPEFQITNENSVTGYINFMRSVIERGLDGGRDGGEANSILQPNYSRELTLVEDPAALVARLNLLLTAGQLSATTVTTIRNAIATLSTDTPARRNQRVWAAILLVMACPEYLVQK